MKNVVHVDEVVSSKVKGWCGASSGWVIYGITNRQCLTCFCRPECTRTAFETSTVSFAMRLISFHFIRLFGGCVVIVVVTVFYIRKVSGKVT
jgi:hypothetical protein